MYNGANSVYYQETVINRTMKEAILYNLLNTFYESKNTEDNKNFLNIANRYITYDTFDKGDNIPLYDLLFEIEGENLLDFIKENKSSIISLMENNQNLCPKGFSSKESYDLYCRTTEFLMSDVAYYPCYEGDEKSDKELEKILGIYVNYFKYVEFVIGTALETYQEDYDWIMEGYEIKTIEDLLQNPFVCRTLEDKKEMLNYILDEFDDDIYIEYLMNSILEDYNYISYTPIEDKDKGDLLICEIVSEYHRNNKIVNFEKSPKFVELYLQELFSTMVSPKNILSFSFYNNDYIDLKQDECWRPFQ